MFHSATAKKYSLVASAFLATSALVAMVYTQSGQSAMGTSTMPIAIYCQRKVINEVKYKEDWTAFSNYIFEGTPGVKAIFSVMDKVD